MELRAEDPLFADLPKAPAKRLRARSRKDGSRREKQSIVKVRNALAQMLEDNAPQFQELFKQAAAKDPIKAMVLVKDLAEYFLPKLGRVEQVGTVEHKVAHFIAVTQREARPAALEAEFTEIPKLGGQA
jgi:hypothetical protein